MDKTPKEYKSLAEMPHDLLASNVVGTLLEAKGNINMWQAILEHFVATFTKEITGYITPQIRAAAIEDAVTLCAMFAATRNIHNEPIPETASRVARFLGEKISTLATLPSSHVCVPVELNDAQILAIHAVIGGDDSPSFAEAREGWAKIIEVLK